MSTYRQLVYLVLDELKITTDDSSYTEEHIAFLLSKYRAFLLKQRYSDIKKPIPDSNFQSICLNMEEVPAICGEQCALEGFYMKSTLKIPFPMSIATPRVYKDSFYVGNIAYINKSRMKYIGYNKYMLDVIYSSVSYDNYLYLKSFSESVKNYTTLKFSAVFEDSIAASELMCDIECELLDREFPIEDALVPPLVELVLKELSSTIYRPEDNNNNTKDDLSEVNTRNG